MEKKKTLKIIGFAALAIVAVLIITVGFIGVKLSLNTKAIYENAIRLLDENYEYIHSVYGDRLLDKQSHIARTEEVYETVTPFLVPFGLANKFNLPGKEGGEFDPEHRRVYISVDMGDLDTRNPSDEHSRSMLHELKHADDQNDMFEVAGSFVSMGDCTFTEGASSFWQYYPSSKFFCNSAHTDASDEHDGSVQIGSTNYSYGRYQYQYEMFLALTDYDTISEYTISAGKSPVLKNKLKEKYGSVIDVDYYCTLAESNGIDPSEDWVMEQANMFADCLLLDAERVSDREQAFQTLNLYRFLKAQVIPRCYGKNHEYCTGDYIKIDEVESALFEKVREYGLLDSLTADETQQRFIFDCLLYMPDDDSEILSREYGERWFAIEKIPMTLSGLRLVFDAKSGTLQLYDPESGEAFAQYVSGGLYYSIMPGEVYEEPIEPVKGTQLVF